MQVVEINQNDITYPQNLYNIKDRPKKIYALGNIENLRRNCVTIVGCRKCTENGGHIAKKIAYNLAKKNYVIVSGLARGIDSYAHIGALHAKGRTIAVLGNGLNKIYPIENSNLAKDILANEGTLISEYDFNSPIKKENFARRNRIISGLSMNTIIVEAGKRSGALITANYAIEEGRNVYCVPGRIDKENSRGTNELIKNGAKILYSL